jgi:hypothetical protein
MTKKSEVYSWRVSPALKAGLEEAARQRGASVAQLLDEIVEDHLTRRQGGLRSDEEEQRQLHERAGRFAGSIAGKAPGRSTKARLLVRARLRQAHRAR